MGRRSWNPRPTDSALPGEEVKSYGTISPRPNRGRRKTAQGGRRASTNPIPHCFAFNHACIMTGVAETMVDIAVVTMVTMAASHETNAS